METPPVVGRPFLLRALNEQAVLEALRKNGPLTRTALTSRLHLSKSTVSAIVHSLLAQRLVTEHRAARAGVGRRPRQVALNPDAGYVVGVDLGATRARLAVADLSGQVRARRESSTPQTSLDDLLRTLDRMYARALADARVPRRRVTALGIGVPGAVDAAGEVVRLCVNVPYLNGAELRQALQNRLRVAVVMDNDVNLAAVGEKWRGRAGAVPNFAYLAVGTGVGMGIVLGGELYRGATGYAGEVGYLPVPAGGTHAPVETFLGGPGVARLARERADRATPEDLFAAARAGDPRARRVVDQVARLLAWTIACVNATLDLSLIVLGGGIGQNADLLLAPVREHLQTLVPFAPEVAPSALAGEASLLGAVAVALRAGRALAAGGRRR
ncbi:MAG: ROK family transcriptional regulator [Armatimonadota bacterium]|nr:ROK family transcriptional regulator [Armatimonadota bacterium]MDR7403050.1 ROK family transcriptional regulator [Armatimonadota bacterium]